VLAYNLYQSTKPFASTPKISTSFS